MGKYGMHGGSNPREIHWDISPRGCWIVTSHQRNRRGGYPRVKRNGRRILVSHLIFEDTYGPIPAGMRVLHTCDNPGCVNPEHLFLGTQADNVADMIEKHRKNCATKLSASQVRNIRRWSRFGITNTRLAKLYGVTQPTIHCAVQKKTHAEVTDEEQLEFVYG